MASDCSELESAIETLVHKYYDYAKKEGKHDKMNKKELSNVLTYTKNKERADELFQRLEQKKEGKIGFEEYWALIGDIALKLSLQMALQYQGRH
ncbi:protein S100-A16-like [Anomaloglossus baeobatrachus]|uniref:protein S100-A16-like n=1 Tax=Anomaloglossus baeobatrachus TaxID=238106 RepID=UPI003F4F8C15